MHVKRILTADGSHSLFVPGIGEHYHSTYGAISESMHVFIHSGLRQPSLAKKCIQIFEVGFGTGLNAFLTLMDIERDPREVHYTAVETYPLTDNVIRSLNYPEKVLPGSESLFLELHNACWNQETGITKLFSIHKIHKKLEDAELKPGIFDLVYFDAFGPEVQPELWTERIFSKLYNAMKPGGILVTFSCKGSVRRSMRNAGFMVEKLPGPPGKREITRARKNNQGNEKT